ncbi:MAG: response regulator, partial [Bacteroidia bacterium]|nr:response regulator [Bacteroidia bacterium]
MKKPVILCVDDEKAILDSLQEQILSRLGNDFDCEIAESGFEALDIIKEFSENGIELAVVISDQLMPGMKGDDFLIRVHSTHPETVKILLTGQASLEAVRRAINQAKLYRYVNKPWEENDLMLTVEEGARSYLQYLQLLEHNRLLRSLNKATQDLSSEIDFRRLVNKLMQNVIDNTNAEKGYLLVEKDGSLSLEAVASSSANETKQLTLRLQKEQEQFNAELIEKVTSAIENDQFPNYRFVTPISKKGKNLGYLYLENSQSRATFNYNQREVLQMLASQAAISIENANLYARLEERTRELQEEKEKVERIMKILEEKNQDITDSIRYAKRIQETIMPDKALLQQMIPESFILYKSKEIVSGDFYWFTEKAGKVLLAAVDCTGHGVPGAF